MRTLAKVVATLSPTRRNDVQRQIRIRRLANDVVDALSARAEIEDLDIAELTMALLVACGGWTTAYFRARFPRGVPAAAVGAATSDFRMTLLANLMANDALPAELVCEYERALAEERALQSTREG